MWKWKLLQFVVMIWVLFKFIEIDAFDGNRTAQGLVAIVITILVTEWLVWLICLPRRLRYRWEDWRRERATGHQPARH
jgi:hypothetical protein